MVRHCLKISEFTKDELIEILNKVLDLKAHPEKYAHALEHKTLLMLFQKPSLRTRVSFETGMTQMGGHAIFYNISDGPLGVKETYEDTAKVLSRFVDIVMARVNKKEDVGQLAHFASIPIINALDDWAHPCQMLADLTTIIEKKGMAAMNKDFKLAYCGDLRNNVTYDLMRTASVMGFEIHVAGPSGEGYDIHQEVIDECAALCKVSGGCVKVCKTAEEACTGVDAIYCDSWMSYGIPKEHADARVKMFSPFRVTAQILALAKPDAIFMNCLPAARGMEQTAEVIDGPQSVIFDEAENRLHTCKALMLFLLNAGGFGCKKGEKCCGGACACDASCKCCKDEKCCKEEKCCKKSCCPERKCCCLGDIKSEGPCGVAAWLKCAAHIDDEAAALVCKNKLRYCTLCQVTPELLMKAGFALGDAIAIINAVHCAQQCCC